MLRLWRSLASRLREEKENKPRLELRLPCWLGAWSVELQKPFCKSQGENLLYTARSFLASVESVLVRETTHDEDPDMDFIHVTVQNCTSQPWTRTEDLPVAHHHPLLRNYQHPQIDLSPPSSSPLCSNRAICLHRRTTLLYSTVLEWMYRTVLQCMYST